MTDGRFNLKGERLSTLGVLVYFTLTVLVLVLAHLDSNEHLVGTRDLVENAIALAGSNRKTDLKYMKLYQKKEEGREATGFRLQRRVCPTKPAAARPARPPWPDRLTRLSRQIDN